MYIGSNIRPKLDKEIEALAQAINRNSRMNNTEYSFSGITQYALSKLLARLVQLQGGVNSDTLTSVLGSLLAVEGEVLRKVQSVFADRQRNLNGEVFAELT